MTSTIETSLFGFLPVEVESKATRAFRREKAMKRALSSQSEAFKTAFRKFAIEFAERNEKFLAEEITFEYKETSLPKPYSANEKNAWKSTGGIIQKLIADGYLEHYCIDGKRQFEYCRSGARQMAVYTRGKR